MTDTLRVYYLCHRVTGERCFRVYKSLSAARIAQRSRNRRLGFLDRVERVEWEAGREAEQCRVDGVIETATYVIEEGWIESEADRLCE